MSDHTGELIALVIFVAAAAFFAASEAAIVAVSRITARTYAEKGIPGAHDLDQLLHHRGRTLTSILVANTFVLLATDSVATSLFIHLGIDHAAVWSTLVATVVLLLFGEIIPKMLAVGDPGAAALRISRWLLVLTWILTPITATFLWLTHGIVRLFGGTVHHGPYVTEDDIKTLVNVGVEQNVLEEGERELIHSIIEFGDTVVREVMSPRTDLVAVDVSASPRAVLDLVITEGYSKIPAYENSIDNVVGVVHDRELLTILAKGALASTTIRELMRPVALVPENKRVSDLLREMQRGKFSIAVVVDEWGGTAGIVTMEDLLEEIVGEIRDERDEGEEEPIHHVGASEWIVTAGSNIQDVNDALGIHLPDDEFETIGGFTVGLFGRMPTVGEEIDADEVRLRIERARGRRILAVRVKRLVAPEDEVAVLETHHASEH